MAEDGGRAADGIEHCGRAADMVEDGGRAAVVTDDGGRAGTEILDTDPVVCLNIIHSSICATSVFASESFASRTRIFFNRFSHFKQSMLSGEAHETGMQEFLVLQNSYCHKAFSSNVGGSWQLDLDLLALQVAIMSTCADLFVIVGEMGGVSA